MPLSRRLPVSARKTDVLRMAQHVSLPVVIQLRRYGVFRCRLLLMLPQISKRDWKWCWSAFSPRCRTELSVHFHQPRERVSLHLLHHFAPVRFYGNHADAEFVSDLFIQ